VQMSWLVVGRAEHMIGKITRRGSILGGGGLGSYSTRCQKRNVSVQATSQSSARWRNSQQPTTQPTVVLTCTSLEGFTQPSATCKLLNVWESHRLKRLASAVQLRPWPPSFQRICRIPLRRNSPTVYPQLLHQPIRFALRQQRTQECSLGLQLFRCDGLSVDIQGGANVAVAQKFLRHLWVVVVSNQMRSQGSAKGVKTNVALHPGSSGGRFQVVRHEHVGARRLPPFQLERRKDEILVRCVGTLFAPTCQMRGQ